MPAALPRLPRRARYFRLRRLHSTHQPRRYDSSISRRYDSAGVCIEGADRRLVIIKATGKVDRVEELANTHIEDKDAGAFGDEVITNYSRCILERHTYASWTGD